MGIVYLIQPAELVGTDRVKVGCSNKSDLTRVTKGYKNGTISICICSTEEPFVLEKTIIGVFKERFKLLTGNEYFVGDINDMRKVFFQQVVAYNATMDDVYETRDAIIYKTGHEALNLCKSPESDSQEESNKNTFNK